MSRIIRAEEESIAAERKANSKRNVVVVALRSNSGHILMVRTKNFPTRWQPIGGGMEPVDPSPAQALVREVSEELGIKIEVSALDLILETSYDFGEGKVFCYLAEFDSEDQQITFNEETVEHRWVSIIEAQKLEVFPATEKFLHVLRERERAE